LKIRLDSIKPSPYNPKEPFTKKRYNALRRHVEKHGFLRDLLICKDYDTGEGFYCLDGHTAIELLKDLGNAEADCRLVEGVTDYDSLVEFITGYAISKKPSVSEIYKAVGDRMTELFGVDTKFFQEKTAKSVEKIRQNLENSTEYVKQTQYFLTLPPDCVQKLKGFTKTKAFKSNKTEAIVEKIDSMNEQQFLENLFQIIL
jgi:hypothetical protein